MSTEESRNQHEFEKALCQKTEIAQYNECPKCGTRWTPPELKCPTCQDADQPTATATPRTDAEEFFLPPEAANCIEPPQNDGVVESKYARTLERELSSAQAALAEAQAKLSERKTVHEWLNANGVPAVEEGGRPMCLLRRLAVALKIQPHKSP